MNIIGDISHLALSKTAFDEMNCEIPSLSCHFVEQKDPDYYLLKRDDSYPWFVARTFRDHIFANFQGNPLWPSRCFNRYPEIRTFFGISIDDAISECIVPKIELINRKLAQLNQWSTAEYSFSFEHQADHKGESSGKVLKNFVDNFIDRRIMPFGKPLSMDYIHDWSYHFIASLYWEYLENLRLCLCHIRTQLLKSSEIEDVVERPWVYYGHSLGESGTYLTSVRPEKHSYKDTIYRQMARSIDVVTGRVTQLSVYLVNGGYSLNSELALFSLFINENSDPAIKRVLYLETDVNAFLIGKDNIVMKSSQVIKYIRSILFSINSDIARFTLT